MTTPTTPEGGKLLPCPTPWCKRESEPWICPVFDLNEEEKSYFVMCSDCGVNGPEAETKEQALSLWNTRAS